MKRLFTALMCTVLLCGCAEQPQPQATTPTLPPETGLYQQNSPVEAETAGAVRTYAMEADALYPMGEALLLRSGSILTLFSPETGCAGASLELPAQAELLRVTDDQVGYYDPARRAVVLLDGGLQEISAVSLPQELPEDFLLSPAMNELYYSTGMELRAFDLQNGISRLINRQLTRQIAPVEVCFSGALLLCRLTGSQDGECYAFLSAQTGEILGTDSDLRSFSSSGERCFLERASGTVTERLFGSLDGSLHQLVTEPLENAALCLLGDGTSLLCAAGGNGTELTLYDLTTGKRTAALHCGALTDACCWTALGDSVWFLARQEDQGVLCRWDPAMTPTGDSESYMAPRYTAENPDTEGLARCQAEAEALGGAYGIDIRIWADAAATGGSFSLTGEYQVPAIQSALDTLRQSLERFPEGFFQALCRNTPLGKLQICLVRSMEGGLSAHTYWPDGNAYIALSIGSGMEERFYHELSYVLDSYIIAESLYYDDWEELNPRNFSYDLSYSLYARREDSPYLGGDDPAFLDSYSMTYPKEDRANILMYAMSSQGEGRFETPTLQKKLAHLCAAIRDAYGWEDREEIFPWEQYLLPAE